MSMEIRAAEISEILKQQIKDFDNRVEVRETGKVLATGDGIARIHGLERAAAGELLQFPHDLFGMVLNLEEDNVGAAIFGEAHLVAELLQFPHDLFGMVLNLEEDNVGAAI